MRERVDDGVFTLRGRPIRGGIDGEVREEEIEVRFYIYRNGLGELRVGWEEPTNNLLVEGHRVHLGSLQGDIIRYWLRSGRPQAVAEARRREEQERRRLRRERNEKLYKRRVMEFEGLRMRGWIYGESGMVGVEFEGGYSGVIISCHPPVIEIRRDGDRICVVRWKEAIPDEDVDLWEGDCSLGYWCPHCPLGWRTYYQCCWI